MVWYTVIIMHVHVPVDHGAPFLPLPLPRAQPHPRVSVCEGGGGERVSLMIDARPLRVPHPWL